jgi:hypothetical protein
VTAVSIIILQGTDRLARGSSINANRDGMNRHRSTRIRVTLGALALATLLPACTTTQAAKPELAQGHRCAYLAPDVCSKLVPGTGDQAALRYISPNVEWSQYAKAMVSPVTVWGGAKRDLSAEDAQRFANYLYQALIKQIGTKMTIVDEPGPGVLKVQAAITSSEAAVPVLRTVSMVIPQARTLATLKYIATDSYPFVGSAQGELEVTDSRTGEVLAAAVDRRIGGGSLATAAQWQWGDVENVMDQWASMTATRLADLRSGKLTN